MRCILLAMLLLALCGTLRAQVYTDLFFGLHPRLINDGGASAHLNFSVGRQASAYVGYGANIGTMAVLDISTTASYQTLGLQYRALLHNHRICAKVETGSLIGAGYSSDDFYQYTYLAAYNPYARIYTGYRFGRFTMGLTYTYVDFFSQDVALYDEIVGAHLPTGQQRTRNQHELQLYLGLSLDSFRVRRRK